MVVVVQGDVRVLLYILVWYGSTVVYSIHLQQFLAAADQHSDDHQHPAFDWRVPVSCLFVVTMQAACCAALDGSILIAQKVAARRSTPLPGSTNSTRSRKDAKDDENENENENENESAALLGTAATDNDSDKRPCSSRGPIMLRSLGVSYMNGYSPCWLTSRSVILTAYSGLASMLQTCALQLAGILCFNSVRAVEPAMAATYVRVAHGGRLAWSSVLGLFMVTAACVVSLSDTATCSVLGNDSGRVLVAVLCGLLINCCMIGRNSLVQMLRVSEAGLYRQSRLEESAAYYLQLLGIMTLLSAGACSTEIGRALYTAWLHDRSTLTLVVSSSAMYAAYNHCSLLVCERVDLVTHSILTIFKRPVLILGSTLYLERRISNTAAIVCSFITLGLALHMRGNVTRKARDKQLHESTITMTAVSALNAEAAASSSCNGQDSE